MSLDSTPAEEVRTPTVGCPQPGGKSVYASLGLGTGLRFRICSGGLASTVAVKHYVGAYVPGGFRLEHTECTGIYLTSRPLDLRPPVIKSQISNQTFLAAALLKLGVLNEAHMSEQAGAYKTRLGGMAMACDKQCNTVVCKAFCNQVANPETPHNGRSGCAILGMRFPEQQSKQEICTNNSTYAYPRTINNTKKKRRADNSRRVLRRPAAIDPRYQTSKP